MSEAALWAVGGVRTMGGGALSSECGAPSRFRAKRDQLDRFQDLSSERQGQEVALTVLRVPHIRSTALIPSLPLSPFPSLSHPRSLFATPSPSSIQVSARPKPQGKRQKKGRGGGVSERQGERASQKWLQRAIERVCERVCVCGSVCERESMCVCVVAIESEREQDRGGDHGWSSGCREGRASLDLLEAQAYRGCMLIRKRPPPP